MLFFKDYKDTFLVTEVKQRKLALLPLSLIIILSFTIPASAFYFDFQYFETDKLVYEVGESVSMVASLIADFSPEGYCFVSFAIVTDQGPAFADEYFISPSPNTRLINSTYVINPEQTQPGVDGATAYALFNIELYDSVTQGASDNVEITINRGHLTTYPQTPLIVESDTNTTLTLKIASIYTDNIPYSNEDLNITIRNPESEIIFNENMNTDSIGNFDINWNQSMGLPGIYDLVIMGHGNEDFLEFSKTVQVSVVPTLSNLTVSSAPTSLPCQSPDGSDYCYADITVKHETVNHTNIDDSIVSWNASFGSGQFVFTGAGEYSISIPFTVSPGTHLININAVNSKYQAAMTSIIIEAVRNPLNCTLTKNLQLVTHDDNISLDFLIEEGFNWNESISLEISDSKGEISQVFEAYPGIVQSLSITAWQNVSIGPHNITISATNNHYVFSPSPELQIVVLGKLTSTIEIESAYYAEDILLNITALNYQGNSIELLNISVYNGTDSTPFITIQQIDATQLVSLQLPSWIIPGYYELRFQIGSRYFVPVDVFKNVTIMMRTNITIIVETLSDSNLLSYELGEFHFDVITSSNSLGSIIRPPPILFSGIRSQVSLTTRDTSLDNCPKFNSGINSLSTLLLNSLTA